MGLSTLFGRNVSTRERPPSGLKHVRHTGRSQRLSFGKQLRTFMCFTTEEKLSQGGGSGDKRRSGARGPLSQRLRLTESAEDQSGTSPLEALSGLVVRPSTCPPDPPAERDTPPPPPAHPQPSESPSSFTLSSLDDQQLDAYMKIMFNRCAKEDESRAEAQGSSQEDVGDATCRSGEQLESFAQSAAAGTSSEHADVAAEPTVADKHSRRPTLRECEELIHRHEQLFGPIVTSRPATVPASAPLSHWLPEPLASLPEPCTSSQPDATYLSIPQHAEAAPCETEWDAWRQHFSSGPDGVWRIVAHDADLEAGAEAAEEAPSAEARPRRLFGALRDKCSALFRPEQKARAADTAAVGDTLVDSAATAAKADESTEDLGEKILSETKADDVLGGINEDEVVPCTTGQELCPVPRQPRHNPDVYGDRAFRHWSRFFRWSGAERMTAAAPLEDEPWVTITGAADISVTCVGGPEGSWSTAALPVSLWWGVSLPLESAADRPAALLAQLQPDSSQARLLRRPHAGAAPADRQALWLSRPELPQLFTAAGLGPADMTRWLLRVPHEREDDAVPLRSAAAAAETADPSRQHVTDERDEKLEMNAVKGNTPCESAGHELTPHTTPRAKFFEELMGTSVSDAIAGTPANQREADAVDLAIIKQTETSGIVTPAESFSAGWDARSREWKNTSADQRRDLEGVSVSLMLSDNMAMPLCSDVCTFLLPEHQERSRAESTASAAAAPDARQAYDTYGTAQWNQLGARRCRTDRQPMTTVSAAVSKLEKVALDADPVGRFDSETELGAHLAVELSESGAACPLLDGHGSQLRNSSVRPIDSEVDIAQVLHEQSGYATLGDVAAPAGGGYQALPLHEVDSETELGLALPLTDSGRPLSAAAHRQVTAYDSETEMGALISSLHAVDSETEMGERLRRLAGEPEPEPEPARRQQGPAPADGVTRLPAAPVPVDSETEMGVVLRLFEQGLLSSRYFADVPLPDEELDCADRGVGVGAPESQPERGVHFSGMSFAAQERHLGTRAPDQANEGAERSASDLDASQPQSIDDIYNASKEVSRKAITKALFLLGSEPLPPTLLRTGSSPFGPSSGLDGIELEREAGAVGGEAPCAQEGVCDPGQVIPEVSLTTSDGSFVVLFPPRPVDTAATADYYETDEGLVIRLEQKQQRSVAESRGFQPTEAGLSLSERQLSSTRRLLADRCAEAALRRRSPSPRRGRTASEEGGLRVLYHAEGSAPWPPVSPESGLSGLALVATDPELAAVRWRKSSRGEDGDPEAASAREATPPPDESQSQTDLRKEKPVTPPPALGANSWC